MDGEMLIPPAKRKKISKVREVISKTPLGMELRSELARKAQSARKTPGAGPGRTPIEPPQREIGPFSDRCSQACQMRIAGASLAWIGEQLGVSRERARQLISQAEQKHPNLFRKAMKAAAKIN